MKIGYHVMQSLSDQSRLCGNAALMSWLLIGAAAHAGEIEENEPLVMRLIFEDCLGYVRDGNEPFQGLATQPAAPEAIDRLPTRMPDREKAVELLSPRYIAAWGADGDYRYCAVHTVRNDDGSIVGSGLLGVPPEGFLERITKRAVAEGLTESFLGDEFSPLEINSWSEPETGYEVGPLKPISFSLMPTDGMKDGSLLDAGLFVMGGPP